MDKLLYGKNIIENIVSVEPKEDTVEIFIEKEGKVFVVDFGDARKRGKYMDPFLEDIFDTWELKWNNEFR